MMKDKHLVSETWKTRLIERQLVKERHFESRLKGTTNLTEAQERKIFEYAWDEGHANGEYEVEGIFDRLVGLVEDCLK
jgi:hypothetical protein